MIVIDGSQGEGGGQIFRTSLSLAMCLGVPVRIKNIRAGRNKPGLLRQHLTCLNAAQVISNAEVSGDGLGSTDVTFAPGEIKPGRYRFAVGSAGSTSLVFQTLYMPLALAKEPSELYLEGGTHNGYAPSFDYIASCFLPVLRRLGVEVDLKIERFGFYPAGGGAWSARINPVNSFQHLNLLKRGEFVEKLAVATSARIPAHVTERELSHIRRKSGFDDINLQQRLVESVGPGNIVSLRFQSEQLTEVVECVGERQLKAERVAGLVVKQMQCYIHSGAAVGEYLADQLLLPMALGRGGKFSMSAPSQHFSTNVDVIKQFLDVDVLINELRENYFETSIFKTK